MAKKTMKTHIIFLTAGLLFLSINYLFSQNVIFAFFGWTGLVLAFLFWFKKEDSSNDNTGQKPTD